MNKVTVLRQPADGVRGKQGPILRGPMDWESCASGFSFQAGGENDTYLDYVTYNGNYYMCKTTHTKGSAFVANQWQTAAQIPFVATMLMLAQNAKINFLSGQAIRVGVNNRTYGYFGVPSGSGEILYTGRSGQNEVEVIFSSQTSPANPSGHPNTTTGWTAEPTTDAKWIAVSTSANGTTWSAWSKIAIANSTSSTVIFLRNNGRPETPTGTSKPSNWSYTVPTGTSSLWYCTKKSGGWNDPILVPGASGDYEPSQATFVLDRDGKARWGIPGGQRIEINPQSKELTAYDSDGAKRTTVSGGRLEQSQAIPGGNSVTTFSGTSLIATESSVTTVITTHTAASNGRVEINVPSIMLRAKANNYDGKPSVGVNHEAIPYTSVSVTIELKVGGVTVDRITYSCSSGLGMIDPSESIVDSPVNTVHKAATTLSGTVNAGQSVTVTATTSVQCTGGNGFGGFGDASTTSDAFSGRFVYGQLQCFYGSNGFSLSTDSDNYVFFLFDSSGKLHARCVSDGTTLFNT